jgi:ribonuclease HII
MGIAGFYVARQTGHYLAAPMSDVSPPKTGENGVTPSVSRSTLKLRLLKRLRCTLKFEKQAWAAGAQLVAGVDEVGRGSLFGPVVAGAVILDPKYRIRGLRDSKLLPAQRREQLAVRIRQHCLAWAVAAVDATVIDEINIYQASRRAMLEAVCRLSPVPDHLLIDALRIEHDCRQTPIIHGDARSASIAAASIIAKVERDRMMRDFDSVYPLYGLASNKGYSTRRHIASLREHGPSPLHRQSFAPVWNSNAASPQEILNFMLEDAAEVEGAEAEGVEQEISAEMITSVPGGNA